MVTEKTKDEDGSEQYSYPTVCSSSKKFADENDYPCYGIPVLHAGESYVYANGTWSDWTDALPKFREAHAMSDDFVVENFSIKAYLVSKS